MRVRQVMSAPLAAVSPQTPVERAAALLTEGGATLLPVIDPDGLLVGVVGPRDLPTAPGRLTVGDVMTTDVLVTHPEEGVADMVTVLREAGLRAAPVVQGDTLVGMVDYRDLVHAWARSDDLIRADVQHLLDDERGPDRWRVSVHDGDVTLHGPGGDAAAVRLADSVLGVTAIRVVEEPRVRAT